MMAQLSFFTGREVAEHTKMKKETSCVSCGLYQNCHSPKMNYSGKGRSKVLIIGNSPTEEEDRTGKIFTDSFFKDKLKNKGLDLELDFWKMNAVNCYTKKPDKNSIQCCRYKIQKVIQELQPLYIWIMGNTACESFFDECFDKNSISVWRGLTIPDIELNTWLLPMFHPNYVKKDERNKNLVSQFDRDLNYAIDFIGTPLYFHEDYSENIVLLTNFDDVIRVLKQVANTVDDLPIDPEEIFMYDYETNALKPYHPGFKVMSISFAFCGKAYSFPYGYRNFWNKNQLSKIRAYWKKIQKSVQIQKASHNLKYEDAVTTEFFGVKPLGWKQCTMITAHLLDNRRKGTSLNFQLYTNFGLKPYDKEIKPYLRASGNSVFNRVEEIPLNDLLYYGGMDSYWAMKLLKKQREQLQGEPWREPSFALFHDGLEEFSRIQKNGICCDEEYYHNKIDEIKIETSRIKKELFKTKEFKLFREYTGRRINPNSPIDMRILLYDVLKNDNIYTEKNSLSTDKETLEDIDRQTTTEFIPKLLKLRKLEKIDSTYIKPYIRDSIKGKLHPFFDLNMARTFRSSASSPNPQNVPVRDEYSKKVCRGGIMPSPGNQILETDYNSIEVGTGCFYHQDPKMIKYCTDLTTDIHIDSATNIWSLPKGEITKIIRFYAKNCWVFPQFYGSYYVQCAKNLWINCINLETTSGVVLRDHVKSFGVTDLPSFTEFLKESERKFWQERFTVYNKWKQEINEYYQKNGYIQSHFGFRYIGYMSRNEVSNYLIQGTAFHLLLWSLCRIAEIGRKEGWKTKIIGQIHDSILFDLVPEEREHVMKTVNYISTEKIREEFKWINIPLGIEYEITPIDRPWSEKTEIKLGE